MSAPPPPSRYGLRRRPSRRQSKPHDSVAQDGEAGVSQVLDQGDGHSTLKEDAGSNGTAGLTDWLSLDTRWKGGLLKGSGAQIPSYLAYMSIGSGTSSEEDDSRQRGTNVRDLAYLHVFLGTSPDQK